MYMIGWALAYEIHTCLYGRSGLRLLMYRSRYSTETVGLPYYSLAFSTSLS